MKIFKMLGVRDWIFLVLCIVVCVVSFLDEEYVCGSIITILTVLGMVGSIRENIRKKDNK